MKLNFDELIKQNFIDLEDKGLRDNDLDVLIKVIEQSTVLETLNLRNNNLTLADGKLAKTIAKNTTLKKLYIYNNNIGPEGIKLLADALKKNHTNILQGLYLYDNIIGDAGCEVLSTTFLRNLSSNLHSLYLQDNVIDVEGAYLIANSLAGNNKRFWFSFLLVTHLRRWIQVCTLPFPRHYATHQVLIV